MPTKRKRLTQWATADYNWRVQNFAQRRYPDTWQTMDMAALRVEYAYALATRTTKSDIRHNDATISKTNGILPHQS